MESDIPSPRSISLTGPIGHSSDYESCWRIFCIDTDIVLDSLTRSVNRDAGQSEISTVFIGTKSEYKFLSPAGKSSVTVSNILFPPCESNLSIPLNYPAVLVHGVSPTWTPATNSANWHALDFFANPQSERSLDDFVANVSLAKIDLFFLWGIDGVPSSCLKALLCRWKNTSTQLVFVSQSLMFLDANFVSMFDVHALVAVSAAPVDKPKKIHFPEIDIGRIPSPLIDLAVTNFILPMTEPKLIAPFSSIVSMAPRVLIHGPSKSGKSSLAKWMIRSVLMKTNVNVIEMHASQLFSKYLGGSEKRIEKLFKKAAASSPCIILVEGIHSICPARGADDDEEDGGVGQTYTRVLATFLMSLDGIDSLGSQHNKVAFIGTSLVGPEQLDPAAVRPGRLELHIGLD